MPSTVEGVSRHTLLIKKSRFLARVEPVEDRASAQRVVAALWAEHPSATHVCWALLAGGHSAAVDDGEPSGTAGRPMLEVLRHHDLEGVLATVVRYYGGIPLGAGGLVRAYTEVVAGALALATKRPQRRWVEQLATLPYAVEGPARRALQAAGAELLDHGHADQAWLRWRVEHSGAAALQRQIDDLSQGQARWPTDSPA